MTADWARIPYEVVRVGLAPRIVNEVDAREPRSCMDVTTQAAGDVSSGNNPR